LLSNHSSLANQSPPPSPSIYIYKASKPALKGANLFLISLTLVDSRLVTTLRGAFFDVIWPFEAEDYWDIMSTPITSNTWLVSSLVSSSTSSLSKVSSIAFDIISIVIYICADWFWNSLITLACWWKNWCRYWFS